MVEVITEFHVPKLFKILQTISVLNTREIYFIFNLTVKKFCSHADTSGNRLRLIYFEKIRNNQKDRRLYRGPSVIDCDHYFFVCMKFRTRVCSKAKKNQSKAVTKQYSSSSNKV